MWKLKALCSIWSFLRCSKHISVFCKSNHKFILEGTSHNVIYPVEIELQTCITCPIETSRYQIVTVKGEIPNTVYLHICIKSCLCCMPASILSQFPTSWMTKRSVAVWSIFVKAWQGYWRHCPCFIWTDNVNIKVFELYTWIMQAKLNVGTSQCEIILFLISIFWPLQIL
jgi:hypothetical protein